MKKIKFINFNNMSQAKAITCVHEISGCALGYALDKVKGKLPFELGISHPNYDKYLIMLDAHDVEYEIILD